MPDSPGAPRTPGRRQRVTAGGVLASPQAMKMETHITAERNCVVETVSVNPGDRVAAKDMLILLQR